MAANSSTRAVFAARIVLSAWSKCPAVRTARESGETEALPEAVVAEGSAAVWTMQVSGHDAEGGPFVTAMFTYAGGVGARAGKPGLSTTSYPTGVSAAPLEVVDASAPIRFLRRELRRGSGGLGAREGGMGQTIESTVDSPSPWVLNAVAGRPARGPYTPKAEAITRLRDR
ncbi:hydantoinase B/oxoprolinase family protein [Embleya scabrispora]|uniref:hydantoinase B/oxoprolinase family protein n=1 Tax=Embleya scabrispora TaxID=159449 RepID=UPI001F419936|nr:hydantoinase B/oxoprolinase family protein [Embleya scabrispora]